MFKDRKILFFAPKFFGYEKEIANKLHEMGANVDFFDERPDNSVFVKAIIRINKKIIHRRIDTYYEKILQQTEGVKYDYVFVVNLEAITPSIIEKFRKQQPQATFLLYMWDSIQNKKPALDALSYFHYSYSFDLEDSIKIKNIAFRPLFFIDTYDADQWNVKDPVEDIDLCFLGTIHSDRYNLLQKIKRVATAEGLSVFFYMYFHNPVLFWYRKIRDLNFYQAKYKDFHFTPLSKEEIKAYINRSKAIIDMQHPYQTGLTMRAIEMLGSKKKFITTNENIKQYDFYKEENILIINRNTPEIPLSFLSSPYQEVSKEIRFKYSLEGWLFDIFKLPVNNMNTERPPLKVSVITVVFENRTFIRDAIESVLSQDYPHIEYIVVDGGSKDGSLEIIKSYGDRIHHIVSESDEGIYDAMNKGIRLANGDIIGFLNSDDFYANSKVVSTIAEAFHDRMDAVYADLDYVSNKNKNRIVRAWRSGNYTSRKFYSGWMPPHPTFFVRREVYEKLGGYNITLQSSADYELMLRFILKHSINLCYIPQVVVKMRVGGQSNRSFGNRIKAHLEDRKVWKLNGLKPNFYTLWLKPFQKIFQYRF